MSIKVPDYRKYVGKFCGRTCEFLKPMLFINNRCILYHARLRRNCDWPALRCVECIKTKRDWE